MKKSNITFSIILLLFVWGSYLVSNSNGGFTAGYTGAPIDNGLNCTSCHGGNQPGTNANLIQSNIPSDGYEPGTTYTITINASHPTFNRFGFMLTAQTNTTSNHAFLGTWTLLNNQTQLRLNNRYVSHTSQGTAGSNNARTWQVQWTAPPAGSGSVAFFASVNAANGNGTTSGDQTILGNLVVGEKTVSMTERNRLNALRIFPNPVVNEVVNVISEHAFTIIEVFAIDGRKILSKQFDGENTATLQLHGLNSGLYLLTVANHQQLLNVQKILIP